MHLDVALGDDVFGKGAVFGLHGVGAVDEAAHPVTLLEGLLDGGADFLHDTGVVAADEDAGRREVLDVLPIRGVQGHANGLDEDVVVAELGDGAVGDQVPLLRGGDGDGFLRHGGGVIVMWNIWFD